MTRPVLATAPTPTASTPSTRRAASAAEDRAAARRAWATVSALAALGAVALLTLAPRSLVAPLHGRFLAWTDLHAQALLAWFPQADAEQALNAMLFVPLGAAMALLLRRSRWPLAVVAGFVVSAAVEYAQQRIPGRVPDLGDVLWNTVGATVGAVVLTLVRLVCAAVRRLRARTARRAGERRAASAWGG